MVSRTSWGVICALFLGAANVSAQWGNFNHQEKGDVFGRDFFLANSPISNLDHDGIFTDYAFGDPTDRANSDVIEMLGPTTNAIVTTNAQSFIQATLFRGAFQKYSLNRLDRKDIVDTITAMKNRAPAIDYVAFPYYNKYLEWTRRYKIDILRDRISDHRRFDL
jgi:hypothetical protein